MALGMEDTRTMLRTLIRSIDRKAEFTASLEEGDPAGVALTVSLRKHQTSMVIPAEQIEAAAADAMHRTQLRGTIKRAIDRMMFTPAGFASTKLVRGAPIEGGFFRVQQGKGGKR